MSFRELIDYSILDSYDERGNRRCRYCGISIIVAGKRKRWYCNSSCERKLYEKFSWAVVRHRVWQRDQRCLYPGCGKPIGMNDDYECHHIVSIEELKRVIGKGFRGTSREYYFTVLEAALDKSNLVTLEHDCHRKVKHFKPERKKRDNFDDDRMSWISKPRWMGEDDLCLSKDRANLARVGFGFKFVFNKDVFQKSLLEILINHV